MTIVTAYALKIGAVQNDESLASLLVDARFYRDVYCPELSGKHPIARIYSEVTGDRVTFQPEICHSSVVLDECASIEEALGAIAQAIDI